MKQFALASTIAITALTLLSPWLLNGAPYIGDSWIHLKKAEEIMSSGRLSLVEYNDMWPLVNLLLAFYSSILNINPLISTQVIPFLASLSALNLYIIAKEVSKSWEVGVASGLALAFTPIYTFITFGSAIMKETASLYLATILMAYAISNRLKYPCFTLLALGLVLGHHFASLAIAIFLATLTLEDFLDSLAGEETEWAKSMTATVIYGFFASCWTLYTVFKIGWFAPIDLNSLTMMAWVWLGSYMISRLSKTGTLILQSVLIPLVFLAWRGHLHAIPTPVNPVSIWELRDLLVFSVPALLGVASYWKRRKLRSFLISTTALIIFSLAWSLDASGLVIFTKSLHYYAVTLAIAFGLSASFILKRRFGKMILSIMLLYLILASATGIMLALDGPGAYHQGELLQMKALNNLLTDRTMMDVKLGYLAEYIGLEHTSFHRPKLGEYILLTKTDYTHGVLLGYVWVKLSTFLPHETRELCDRVIDGSYVKLLRTNVI